MKSTTLISIIFFIIALSLVSGVFSITEGFIALAQNSSIKTCKCSIIENMIKVGNTGNINSLYSIKQEGEAAKWSIIRPKSFSLDEKKIKTLTNPINIPCDVKTGEYDLLTYVETGFGLKKVIRQNIIVDKCEIKEVEEAEYTKEEKEEKTEEKEEIKEEEKTEEKPEDTLGNIEVIIPEIEKLCGCKNKTYTIMINSKEPETVKTTIRGPEWAKLGWNSAKDMGANDEFSFDLILEPDCEDLGKKTIKLTTESLNSSNKEENTIEFEFKTEESCNTDSSLTAVKVLKWMIYIIGGFVALIIVLIIILYGREGEERDLEEISVKKKKSKKKA